MDEDDDTSATTVKTLWTDTILEVLYLALKYDKPDETVDKILKQMNGCKPGYIIRKVDQKLGEAASLRVSRLMQK